MTSDTSRLTFKSSTKSRTLTNTTPSTVSSDEHNSSLSDPSSGIVTFKQSESTLTTKTLSESKRTPTPQPTKPSQEPTQASTKSVKPTVTHPLYTTVTNNGKATADYGKGISEPTSEPESEPTEVTPKSEPEDEENATEEPASEEDPNAEGEPEDSNPEGEPEIDFGAFEEPGPDWVVAKEQWQEAWEFHVYFYGACFVLLGLYSTVCVVRLWRIEHLLSRHYFLTLHVLVILVCILRAVYLLVDAYNSMGTYPMVVDYFLYNTVFPCITSLFSILFYALLLATRVRILSRKVQKLGVLIAIIFLHFFLSISTDLIVGILTTAHVLMFICQSFFILWGLLMFIGYLIVFRKLYKGAISRQKNFAFGSPDRKHNSPANIGNQDKNSKHKYTYGLAVKITFISAFFGVAIVGFEMYGIFGVFGILQPNFKPQPWPWWTYHLIVRTLELLMCTSVAYVASQPLRYMARKDAGRLYQYLLPCNACCCSAKLDNSYDSSTISMENVSDTDHLGWLKKRNKKSQAPYPPHASEKYNDPDATLLVRKIKQSKPSMLVVEDGFVRIRREDEMLPSNQYELDSNSRSSQSSGINVPVGGIDDSKYPSAVVNWNYSGEQNRIRTRENMPPSFSLENYRLPSVCDNRESIVVTEVTDDTDVDIAVTDSEHSETEQDHDKVEAPPSPTSNKSDIFRPLSMIDLAASMESELERAFHSKSADGAEPNSPQRKSKHQDAKSKNSNLPDDYSEATDNDVTYGNYVDSDSEQSKPPSARLLRSPIRRCKSEEKPVSTRTKLFENNRYFSLSSVEIIGKDDDTEIDLSVQARRKRTF